MLAVYLFSSAYRSFSREITGSASPSPSCKGVINRALGPLARSFITLQNNAHHLTHGHVHHHGMSMLLPSLDGVF